MKLLTKTTVYYIAFSFLAFIIGGVILYPVLKGILYREIDENLVTEQLLVEETLRYSDTIPDYHSVFGHMIEVQRGVKPSKYVMNIQDTAVYDPETRDLIACRHLQYIMISSAGHGYTIHIYKPLQRTQSTIVEIFITVIFLFSLLIILLVAVNYFISRRVWIPFYRTLGHLAEYKIAQNEALALPDSSIYEFRMLNRTLDAMSGKIRADYQSLKEFNENAAHELQTPLAIITSKLDLLIQDENLTQDQLEKLGSVYEAIRRMSRLNQGLLLLSKIENNQFQASEQVDLSEVIHKTLNNFREICEEKKIRVDSSIRPEITISMNRILAEVLVSNLVTNAVVHNIPEGWIRIDLDHAALTISNTGLPLKVEPESLFGRFRKSERSRDSVGLGLAIVKKIVLFSGMKIRYTANESVHTLKITF